MSSTKQVKNQTKKRVCVVGVLGRMGQRLVQLLQDNAALRLASGLCAESELAGVGSGVGADVVGAKAGLLQGHDNVLLSADVALAVGAADVIIDFSAPPACARVAPACARLGKPYVLASTGLTAADEAAVAAASKSVAVLQAANMSTGVNVLLELVSLAAQRLGVDFDVEIAEIHHRHKRDAPSGTALALGQAVQQGRAQMHGETMQTVLGRQGASEPRSAQQLGYAALRGGDASGEHTVYFLGEGERIELTHRSSTANIFAAGALRAALWLSVQGPGCYSMRDVLQVPAQQC